MLYWIPRAAVKKKKKKRAPQTGGFKQQKWSPSWRLEVQN